MRLNIFIWVTALAVLAGCSLSPAAPTPQPTNIITPPPSDTGIQGRAVTAYRRGPTQTDFFPQREAVILVMDAQENLITRVQADTQGYFRVILPPGTYLLRAEWPFMAPDQMVIVVQGQMTGITLVNISLT